MIKFGKGMARVAMVGTAAAAALGLTATAAMADTRAAWFTYSQADWYSSNNTNIWAANGVELIFQSDGNLVLYRNGAAAWASGSDGTGVNRLDWSQSGYIKLYSGSTLMCTIGGGAPGGRAMVQDDGNFVFYNTSNQATWATGTWGGQWGTIDACGF